MLTRTEGIVLRTFPYGEADLLVTYLTRDLGVKKAFARSPRKVGSRFGGSLEPFTHATISLLGREDAPLPRLTQSDIIRSYQELREDYRTLLGLSGMAELTLNFLHEGARSPGAFQLLVHALGMMASGSGTMGPLVYQVRFLRLMGYAPRLTACARCGGRGRLFHRSQGAVVCGGCARSMGLREEEGLDLSEGSRRLYHTLGTWELEKTARVNAPGGLVSELALVLNSHVEHTLARRLRTAPVFP
jgi:DNA repair protein RecO (recombination protein O)